MSRRPLISRRRPSLVPRPTPAAILVGGGPAAPAEAEPSAPLIEAEVLEPLAEEMAPPVAPRSKKKSRKASREWWQAIEGPDPARLPPPRQIPWLTPFLIFSATLALGMATRSLWAPHPPEPAAAPAAPAPKAPLRKLSPETFDWLHRFREASVVADQLEKEVEAAQAFYRENKLDEFLAMDPWTTAVDQLYYLYHFSERGFFTVVREHWIAVLEQKLARQRVGIDTADASVADRLQNAVDRREGHIATLRQALTLYQRGQEEEITIPTGLTPEQEQALRAMMVDRMAAERKKCDALDARIDELQRRLGP